MPLDPHSRDALEAAYRATNYVVDDRSVRFTIRLDEGNAGLREFLTAHGAHSWAFLTAYNPYSRTVPDDVNIVRQAELTEELEQEGYEYYRGRGVGDDWEEPSLFVVDINRSAAMAIAQEFEQNAILWGESDGKAELIWCV